jgi:ketosteroid isomerase-like protein
MMKLGLFAAALSLLASAVSAATPDELMSAPRRFIDSLDKGDIPTASSTMTADVTMLDEFPPHAWSGPDALKHWLADYDSANKAAHITDGKVKLGDPIVAEATGNVAYVVAAASETYKQDGKRMAESARMVFALRRDGGSWKIAAWAWAGRKPHVAGAGAAKAS